MLASVGVQAQLVPDLKDEASVTMPKCTVLCGLAGPVAYGRCADCLELLALSMERLTMATVPRL